MSILVMDEPWVREPRLLVPRQAPLGRVRLDTSHWLAQRAAAIVVGDTELFTGRKVTFVGATYQTVGDAPAIVTGDSANQYAYVPIKGTISAPLTVLEHKRRITTSVGTTRAFTCVTRFGSATDRAIPMYISSSGKILHFTVGAGSGANNVWGNTAVTWFATSQSKFYASLIGNTTTSKVYLDGATVTMNDGAVADGSYGTDMNTIIFGASNDNSLPGAYALHSCVVVPGLMTFDAYMRWYTNPYEFCIPA